jgi:tape measure domain-containing protein
MAGRYDGEVIINTDLRTGDYEKALKEVEDNTAQMLENIKNMSDSAANSLKNILTGIGLGLGAREIAQLAGTMTDLESRARIASKGLMDTADIMDRLRQIADRAYSPLEATANAFFSNATTLNDLGMSMRQQLDLADAMTNALVVSGAKGEMFELVMNAVNRSLAIGKMRGEELEMVLKYGGAAAEAMAKGLGTTLNGLKEMAKNGQLTSDVVATQLIGAMDEFRAKADAMPATVSDAFERLRNQVITTVGEINSNLDFEQTIVKGIDLIKDNLGSLADILPTAVAGMAAFGMATSGTGRALQANIAAYGASAKAIIAETGALSKKAGLLPAIKAQLTGIDAELAKHATLWQAVTAALTKDNVALAEHAATMLANATAAKVAAASELTLAKAAQTTAIADAQAATAGQARVAAMARVTETTTALIAAEQRLTATTNAETAARAMHTSVMQTSALATHQAALVEVAASIEGQQALIRRTEAEIARVSVSTNLNVQTTTRIRLERILKAQQAELAALEAKRAAAIAGIDQATKKLAISMRILTAAGAAASKVMAFFGGPLGMAWNF